MNNLPRSAAIVYGAQMRQNYFVDCVLGCRVWAVSLPSPFLIHGCHAHSTELGALADRNGEK